MSNVIKTLKDKSNGDIIYPQTSVEAVYDGDTRLDYLLEDKQNTTYIQSSEPSDPDTGDIWVDTTPGTGNSVATQQYVQDELTPYRTSAAQDIIDATKANKTYVDAQLALKADKTALAETDRELKFLYELTQGQAWDFDRDDNNAYEIAVPSGAKLATVQKYGGKTLVFNQLVQNGNFESTSGWRTEACTIFVTSNILNIVATGASPWAYIDPFEYVTGHRYLILADAKQDESGSMRLGNNQLSGGSNINFNTETTVGSFVSLYYFFTSVANIGHVQLRNASKTSGNTMYYKNVMCIDLTQMFGAGNEPTTVEEFKAMFPDDYYEYNTGEIIHADVDKIVEQGKNLFNSANAVHGKVIRGSDGVEIALSNQSHSEFIPVIPSTQYYFMGINSASIGHTGAWFDANKTFISGLSLGVASKTSAVVTAPSNAKYVVINYYTDTESGVCIYKSATEGSYIPYRHNDIPIPQAIRNIEGYGWSAGNVYNEVDFERKKFIKRVGSVDLGSLSWTFTASTGLFTAIPSDGKVSGTTLGIRNVLCSKYKTNTTALPPNINDKELSFGSRYYSTKDSYIAIKDSNYTTESAFKAAMIGVYLYYELATPVEVDITDILDSFEVEQGGTITFHNSNGDGYRLPVPSTEEYTVKLSEVVSNG